MKHPPDLELINPELSSVCLYMRRVEGKMFLRELELCVEW